MRPFRLGGHDAGNLLTFSPCTADTTLSTQIVDTRIRQEESEDAEERTAFLTEEDDERVDE